MFKCSEIIFVHPRDARTRLPRHAHRHQLLGCCVDAGCLSGRYEVMVIYGINMGMSSDFQTTHQLHVSENWVCILYI